MADQSQPAAVSQCASSDPEPRTPRAAAAEPAPGDGASSAVAAADRVNDSNVAVSVSEATTPAPQPAGDLNSAEAMNPAPAPTIGDDLQPQYAPLVGSGLRWVPYSPIPTSNARAAVLRTPKTRYRPEISGMTGVFIGQLPRTIDAYVVAFIVDTLLGRDTVHMVSVAKRNSFGWVIVPDDTVEEVFSKSNTVLAEARGMWIADNAEQADRLQTFCRQLGEGKFGESYLKLKLPRSPMPLQPSQTRLSEPADTPAAAPSAPVASTRGKAAVPPPEHAMAVAVPAPPAYQPQPPLHHHHYHFVHHHHHGVMHSHQHHPAMYRSPSAPLPHSPAPQQQQQYSKVATPLYSPPPAAHHDNPSVPAPSLTATAPANLPVVWAIPIPVPGWTAIPAAPPLPPSSAHSLPPTSVITAFPRDPPQQQQQPDQHNTSSQHPQ